MNKMFCPICQTELISGENKCYQTLDEHVVRPNDSCPMRETVVCANKECKAHKAKVFWAYDGEGPYHDGFGKFSWINNNPVPFGSYHRAIHFRCSYHEEDSRLSVGKLTVRREIKYESDDYGHKTGERVRYTIWWNNIMWIPGYRMFLFSLRQFYRNKRLGTKYAIEEVKGMTERSKWPRAGWWRKAACFWIRLFHRSLYRKSVLEIE
ncbi:MAG: hypothetical protein KAS32_19305 [Candidatus Peribacteraceae bacterium]|nr:hypothetical protein [Candidatus Peribacteraceae bacterium]